MQMLYNRCAKQRILCFFLILRDYIENFENRIDTFPLTSLNIDSEATGKVSKYFWAHPEVFPAAPN